MDRYPQDDHDIRYSRLPAPAQMDRYLPPAEDPYGELRGYPGEAASTARPNLLKEYLKVLRSWRKAILIFAVAGAALGLLLTLGALPVYQARTSLDIQSLNGDFMNRRDVAPTGDAAGAPSDTYIQTQIKLLQSDTLFEQTVRQIESEPHPATVAREDLLSRLARGLHLTRGNPIPYHDLVLDTAHHVKVKPLGLTRLVEITCDSWDPAFAAKFCNTLVSQFQTQDQDVRGAEAKKTSEWLTRQLADVRAKYEDSEKRLEQATGGNGLVLSQESNSVSEDRLRQMQAELIRAQADRMEKEAQAALSTSASADTLPSVQDSAPYLAAQSKLADLEAQVALLVPPLTEENPRVIHLRAQIREVQTQMTALRRSSTSRVQNEYNAAKHREDLLRSAYETAEASVSSELSATSKVNLLRREVDSEQQLYQTLLQRAKEAGFASAMQVSTIRVVDEARSPKLPVSPRRGLSAIVGLVLGCLVGIAYAFLRERNTEVFRAPGEVAKFLRVHELGVIPAAAGGSRGMIVSTVQAGRSLTRGGAAAQARERVEDQKNALSIAGWNENFSIVAEAYRNATYSILLADTAGGRARMYVVSSPNAGEGKTTVTSNLGVALARSKRRVVLIDGDLRKPGLHRAFSVPNDRGLRNILRGEVDLLHCPVDELCQPTAIPNLSVVSSGTGDEEVVELLHSQRMSELLARLSQEFDLVLIDTPPMLHMADARIFAGHADGAILVLRAGSTSRDEAATARDLFEHDRVRMVGTILNGFDPQREGRGGYYKSYYRYQQAAESGEGKALQR